MTNMRRIFPGGNTSKGFFSFHDYIIGPDRKMLYILKGMPGGGKSSLMKDVAERMIEEGYTVEYHHCPSDPTSVDAIVIKELKIGIIDGTFPHMIDPTYPGITEKIIDLGQYINSDILANYTEDIYSAKLKNKQAYRRAFNYFKAAKLIHEEIVETNKTKVDFNGINKLTMELIEEIFSNKVYSINLNGFNERHLFSTAYTPEGFVDYTNSILDGIGNIYYIEGEVGTGKSTLINRVIDEAKIRNYNIEIFHNSLIPEKIESVLIHEIDTIITSNINGEKVAKNKINLNQYFDKNSTNKEDYEVFNLLVEKGIKSLESAKNNHFVLETSYKPSVDYDKVTDVKEKVMNEILSYL